MKYYLHRISHHMEWSHPLLFDKNLLSIGWSDFGAKSDFVDKHKDDWSTVPITIEQERGRFRSRFGLQRFLEMEPGDKVVVPTWGAFHVYEVADDKRMAPAQIENHLTSLRSWNGTSAEIRKGYIQEQNEGAVIDLGFFRRVEPLSRDIPRSEYADAALTRRMKVQLANVEITDLKRSIENSIKSYKKNHPINLRSLIMDRCAKKLLDTILEFQSPDQFEDLVEQYFKRQGATTDKPAKNERNKEGDADIIATFESLNLIIYVQAKRHEGETDDWAVEQIKQYTDQKNIGNDDDFARLPWVISTAKTFSEDCIEKARHSEVRLVNGIEFAQMLLDAGIEQL